MSLGVFNRCTIRGSGVHAARAVQRRRGTFPEGRRSLMLRTPFTQLIGCTVPIQQAPMGTVSSPALALSVADAGGVGSITAMGMPPEQLDAMLADMASKTRGALAANFLTDELDR